MAILWLLYLNLLKTDQVLLRYVEMSKFEPDQSENFAAQNPRVNIWPSKRMVAT